MNNKRKILLLIIFTLLIYIVIFIFNFMDHQTSGWGCSMMSEPRIDLLGRVICYEDEYLTNEKRNFIPSFPVPKSYYNLR